MPKFFTVLAVLLCAVAPVADSFSQTPAAKPAASKTAPVTTDARAGGKSAVPSVPPAAVTPAKPSAMPQGNSKESPNQAGPAVGKPSEVSTPTSGTKSAPVETSEKPRLEKISLDYRFAKGETLRSRVTQQTRVETSIGGSTQIAEMASVSIKRWVVKDVDKEGNVTFETQWDSIDMRQKMTGREEVRYNSATDKTPPAGYDQIATMIGKPLSLITVDPRGKIVRREAKDAETQKTLANSTYQAEQQLLVPLPGEAVTLGQPWSIPTDIRVSLDDNKSSRNIQARHRYEVEKIEGNIAIIGHETILPPLSDPEIRSQVIQQLGRGKVHFDLKTGKVLKQVSEVDERVIGFRGAESSIHFLSKFTEEMLPATAATPANTATKQPTPAAKK